MDFELWWLLPIPALFFGLGWMAARVDIKHLLRESRALPLSYFRGLNFLLNEQPDKAIESFIEVVKVDPQTIDLHFALGSLFRRQGEIERATRMHQNLLDRPNLPADKREAALFELAQDFHRAGLLDRAEELFTKLDGTAFEHPSLGFLISIYEQEKDWPKAIAVTRRMEAIAKRPYFREIAHYYCELAQAQLVKPDVAAARANIDLALAEYRACTRATMLLGDLELQQGDVTAAIAAWQRIESQNPAFLSLVAERLADAYRRQGSTAQALRVVGAYQREYPSLDLLNTMFTLTLSEEGSEAAGRADQGRAGAQPDAARPRPTARSTAPRGTGGPPSRSRARQAARRAAHQAARPLQVRALRLSRAPVLLAVPWLRQVGNLFAAAHRDARRLRRMRGLSP
jgi:lipopolysaccharide biosynthesis regulator YciM